MLEYQNKKESAGLFRGFNCNVITIIYQIFLADLENGLKKS